MRRPVKATAPLVLRRRASGAAADHARRRQVKQGVGRGYQGLDVGDHVQVELVHVDVERGFIDFARS